MDKYKIEIPELCLVAMVGATSSGKTSFANRYFKSTEVLSSDFFRGMVCDDENCQSISKEAFDLLFYAAKKRLDNKRLTVVDATNIQQQSRKQILDLAKEQNVHTVAIVLNLDEKLLQERNKNRPERNLPERVIYQHCSEVKKSIKYLRKEGFRYVYVIDSLEQLENVEIIRKKLYNNKCDEHGPFDIIGDIHGCYDELVLLLEKLGYEKVEGVYTHKEGRKAVFLGDFCDRGEKNLDVLRLVMDMVKSNSALAVAGNHDVKLLKYLKGQKISITHGIDKTISEIENKGLEFKNEVIDFIDNLISYYILDDEKLVVAHAGIKQEYIGRSSSKIRDFCLYGEVTGEIDSYGLPIRLDWTSNYRGKATIVYGHIASEEVKKLNNTYCIDTGCIYGGKLTAFCYPEKDCVSVDALKQYYAPIKPLEESKEDIKDILTIGDFNHELHISTELMSSIDIRENNIAAALEIMSRFAADPHWLIYLPPTMSPCETSELDDYLEHPIQAFDYYRNNGIKKVVCEKKHMGSRAVIIVCKTKESAKERFGIDDGSQGIIYTRTGRRFFNELNIEKEIIQRLENVLSKTNFWQDFNTDWVCLDTELMPWSEKAQELIYSQYAPTGKAGLNSISASIEVLEEACNRESIIFDVDNASGQNVDLKDVLKRYKTKLNDIERYIDAYREYCWTVKCVDDLKIAPFHILATEGKTFVNETHLFHMESIKKYITGIDSIFIETPYIVVDLENKESESEGIKWWDNLTTSGGEGMVVKPEIFISKQEGKVIQPAIKCRGKEYLRIIYGPEYLQENHLIRLKKRSLRRKRNLALKEFSLGIESLTRFIKHEPLYKVHECVFGVLALESEPVDPRL